MTSRLIPSALLAGVKISIPKTRTAWSVFTSSGAAQVVLTLLAKEGKEMKRYFEIFEEGGMGLG